MRTQDLEIEIPFKVQDQCYTVFFGLGPGEVISCKEPLPLRYVIRNCQDREMVEMGRNLAEVTCLDLSNVSLLFKTSDKTLHLTLMASRSPRGRSGFTVSYKTKEASLLETSTEKLLKAPEVIEKLAAPEESPMRFKYYGFAWVEHEVTSRYGYNIGSSTLTAQPNFDSSTPADENSTFFMNLGLEAGKDQTDLISLFEIGEMYFGDSSSGGNQGGRAGNIFEIRNLYLRHSITEFLEARGGLISTAADPRSFVFNDHVSSLQLNYKSDLSEGVLWYGVAGKNKAGQSPSQDQYYGLNGTLKFLPYVKGTGFLLYRAKNGEEYAVANGATYTTQNANAQFFWGGLTIDYDKLDPLTFQATGILSSVDSTVSGLKDQYTGALWDIKANYVLQGDLSCSVEALGTTGSSGWKESTTGKPLVGKRKNFVSPVGAAYLLTIATSDGADDSPGTPKQSVIGNLGLEEGLNLWVTSINWTPNKKWTAIVRYGILQSTEPSSDANGRYLGSEADLQWVHQLTPSASLQLDLARFYPGSYFVSHSEATLGAAKFKFSF